MARAWANLARSGGGFCCYCKRGPLLPAQHGTNLAFTRDHINPTRRGGGRTVPCCRLCNGLKGNLAPEEWMWFIDAHPGYWRSFRTSSQVTAAVITERSRRAFAGEPPLSRRLMGGENHPGPKGGQFVG